MRTVEEQIAGLGAVAARLPHRQAWAIARQVGDVVNLQAERCDFEVVYVVGGYDIWNWEGGDRRLGLGGADLDIEQVLGRMASDVSLEDFTRARRPRPLI